VHFKFLQLIFSADAKLSLLTQMLLAAIVTLVFLLVGRPMRRMWQMIELSVGAAGAAMPSAGGGLFSRFRRKGQQRTPQDDFWDNLRDGDSEESALAVATSGRRTRPEASNPITATAQRLDTRSTVTGGEPLALPHARSASDSATGGDPALPASGRHHRERETVVVQARASRVVDTVPVTDRGWDRAEDAVVVPSRLPQRGETIDSGDSPRLADIEEIGGRQVHVVYRPSSRANEVSGNRQPRRMPLQSGPRYTDTVVR
jgi:hypothetical protein